ncbi:MAG: 60S ribosomal protein L31 [Nitrososphaerota archaeon]|jgi:large subunit ribosomal protein L31e|nr:60S ribosomal protein L31 [Nitrososphaerota archaeon]MDG6913480.1 60S ribosomal protein L31 [Nitrososphaerota archaeon]MDG6919176.1 60S ribosomal protein L31 [Nitrososphaerota archaeon]MDG6920580.1 60S ribosomal protein L31 [Nitrososphaerota archaeon]MDG6924853.1 60S ribosomal protein L31 [Nitrososphaerota archaeon]
MEELTRTYVVPLGVVYEAPPYRRAKKAIAVIREFTTRHMKANQVSIDSEVNELIWARGIKHPPRRITLEMERDEDGIVTVSLPESEQV